jgi:hypothetical protein
MLNPTGSVLNVQFVEKPTEPITRNSYIVPIYSVNQPTERVNIGTFTKIPESNTYLLTTMPDTIDAVITRKQIAPNAESVTFSLNVQNMILNPGSNGTIRYSLHIDNTGESQLGRLWLGEYQSDYGMIMAFADIALIGGIKFSGYYRFKDHGELEIHTGNNGIEFTTIPIDGVVPVPIIQGNGRMLFTQITTMFSK